MCEAYEAERNWIVECEQRAVVRGYAKAYFNEPPVARQNELPYALEVLLSEFLKCSRVSDEFQKQVVKPFRATKQLSPSQEQWLRSFLG